jgi:hypothetical protein
MNKYKIHKYLVMYKVYPKTILIPTNNNYYIYVYFRFNI